MENKTLTINELDDDVLLIIFSMIDFIDKVRMERVCKRWKDLIDYLLSTQQCLYFSDKNDFDCELSCPYVPASHYKFTDYIELSKLFAFDYLQILGFQELTDLDKNGEEAMSKAIGYCPNLKRIGLIDFYRLENPLKRIIDNCNTNLEAIDIIGSRRVSLTVNEMRIIGEKYSMLKWIRVVSSSIVVAEESLRALFENCQNLEVLIMHSNLLYPPSWTNWGRCGGYRRINGECYAMLTDKIREISTDVRILDNCGLLNLATGSGRKRLTSLDLSGGTWDAWWLQIISQGLKQLKRLKCSKISVFSQEDLDDVALICELSHLEELFLDLSSKIVLNVDDPIYGIMQGCPKLKKIDLFNAFVTDRSLVQINQFWPEMEHLSFHTQMNPGITHMSVPSIAQLKQLQYLNLNGTSIGDEIVEVINNCRRLRDVNLEYTLVTNITVRAAYSIAYARPTEKIVFDLAGTDINVPKSVPANLTIYL